jgi:hypothetical protein
MNPHPAKRHLLPEERRYADREHFIDCFFVQNPVSIVITIVVRSRFTPFAPWEKGWG